MPASPRSCYFQVTFRGKLHKMDDFDGFSIRISLWPCSVSKRAPGSVMIGSLYVSG